MKEWEGHGLAAGGWPQAVRQVNGGMSASEFWHLSRKRENRFVGRNPGVLSSDLAVCIEETWHFYSMRVTEFGEFCQFCHLRRLCMDIISQVLGEEFVRKPGG